MPAAEPMSLEINYAAVDSSDAKTSSRPTNNLRLSLCVYRVEPNPFFVAGVLGVLGVHLRMSRRADAASLAGERSREPAPRKRVHAREEQQLKAGRFLLADPRELQGTQIMFSERKRKDKRSGKKTRFRHRKSQGDGTGWRRWEGEGQGKGGGRERDRVEEMGGRGREEGTESG